MDDVCIHATDALSVNLQLSMLCYCRELIGSQIQELNTNFDNSEGGREST